MAKNVQFNPNSPKALRGTVWEADNAQTEFTVDLTL